MCKCLQILCALPRLITHRSDVIDTESADGDVNKIFLGSFVETYDILENPVISPLEGTLSPSHAPT